MLQALAGADQVRTGAGRAVLKRIEVAAHARGQVQDDVDAVLLDQVHGLLEEIGIARTLARLGITHMDMRDGGTGMGRFDCRIGNLARRHRHLVALAGRVACTSHGT